MTAPKETQEEKIDRKNLQPLIKNYEKIKKSIRDLMNSLEDSQSIKLEIQGALIDFIIRM